MKILLDENLPVKLRIWLAGHEVMSVEFMQWKGLTNGHLLSAADTAGFDVLLTADSKMHGQQHFVSRHIAVLAIPTNKIIVVLAIASQILESLRHIQPSAFHRMVIEGPVARWNESTLHHIEQTQQQVFVHTYVVPEEIC